MTRSTGRGLVPAEGAGVPRGFALPSFRAGSGSASLRVQGVLLRLHVDAFQSGRDPDEDDDADDPRGIGQAVGGGQQYGPCGIKTVHGRGQSGGGGERASEQPCDSGGGQSEAQAAQQGRGKAGGHGGEADSGQFRPPAREDGKESPAGFRAHGVDEQGQPQLPDGWRHLRARRACRHAREEDGGTAQGEMAEGEGTEKTAQRRAQGQYEHPGFQNGHGDLRLACFGAGEENLSEERFSSPGTPSFPKTFITRQDEGLAGARIKD